jgi:DNA helicase-2/ATP-dependent DNA helicase PcrA
MQARDPLGELNPAQRQAAEHGLGEGSPRSGSHPKPPLLIIAGAGTGKTSTLAQRVARLILAGADPHRILLLTFTRRAAAEMTRRTRRILARTRHAEIPGSSADGAALRWSGTFHSIANRLLRLHAEAVGLDPSFTVLDRADSQDLLDLQRSELGFAKRATRFPRKSTCLAIYSHTVNSQRGLVETLEHAFPWCADWGDELQRLFGAYVAKKQELHTLDYDDLLLYWHFMMAEAPLAKQVSGRFDHVLVDEYQDTNALQAAILMGLRPDGHGLTVVGDDAQAIYSFRAASVRNILDFPAHFDPPASVVTLERNYRSTQPILDACNAVIGLAPEGFTKNLFSERPSRQKPLLVTVEDEDLQVEYVVERILEHREAGIALHRQAVLFRTAHHSDLLEVELARRNIPFVKYGGLKFLEAAHVKDLLGILRWAENPRDAVAAFRVLQLLPAVGPAHAQRAIDHLAARCFELASLARFRPPNAAAEDWPGLCRLLAELHAAPHDLQGQLGLARRWYEPHLERIYDSASVRTGDLAQLEQIAAAYPSRERFLTELTLDPPEASGDEAGPPHLDEDHLVLSTIHSAKGQEWDAVFVLNAADGCIPSDMATGSAEEIEEERRLLYVAMSRARDHLHVVHPLRFFVHQQRRHGDRHVYAPRSRFLPDAILDRFERRSHGRSWPDRVRTTSARPPPVDVASRLRAMWQPGGGGSTSR